MPFLLHLFFFLTRNYSLFFGTDNFLLILRSVHSKLLYIKNIYLENYFNFIILLFLILKFYYFRFLRPGPPPDSAILQMAGSNNQLVFCTVLLCTLYSTYVHLLNSETSNKRLQSITVAGILTFQCLLYLKKEQIHFLNHKVHAKLCN